MQLFSADILTDVNTQLCPITLSDVYHRIRDDKGLEQQVLTLRRVRRMDEEGYKRNKARLPFFCCSAFRQGIRRSGHFEAAHGFVLDIDHYSGDQKSIAALRERILAQENRVALMFTSPGGDGLKLVFRFDQPCTDTKRFSDFYKSFALAFAEKHDLTAYMDFRTSDATRVCFFSHDREAYIDPMADRIRWEQFVPEIQQPSLAPLFAEPSQTLQNKQQAKVEPQEEESPNRSHAIRGDVYAEILQKLGTKARPKPVAQAPFVPDAVERAIGPICAALTTNGLEVKSVEPIQYGKRICVASGLHQAEMNLYYGAKKGFSVVLVPKSGHHPNLGKLIHYLAEQTLFSEQPWEGTVAANHQPHASR